MAKVRMPEDEYQEAPLPPENDIKEEAVPSKVSKKVIQGAATTKKRSVFRKMKDTLFAGNKEDVGRELLTGVLVPAAQDTLKDFFDKGIDMMIYGDTRASNRSSKSRSKSGRDFVNYSQFSKNDKPARSRASTSLNFDDIILESRGDAERVLDDLIDKIDQYDVATVADLYDAVDISHDFSHTKYGWYDLSSAYVKRTRDGYVVVLPKAEPLT